MGVMSGCLWSCYAPVVIDACKQTTLQPPRQVGLQGPYQPPDPQVHVEPCTDSLQDLYVGLCVCLSLCYAKLTVYFTTQTYFRIVRPVLLANQDKTNARQHRWDCGLCDHLGNQLRHAWVPVPDRRVLHAQF